VRPDEHPVSVITPTTGRPTLNRCLEALEGQIRPTDEVFVSEDLNRCGVSWARNKGVQRSHGDLIAFTDNDCVPPRDWLERLVRAIDCHDAVGAGGTFA